MGNRVATGWGGVMTALDPKKKNLDANGNPIVAPTYNPPVGATTPMSGDLPKLDFSGVDLAKMDFTGVGPGTLNTPPPATTPPPTQPPVAPPPSTTPDLTLNPDQAFYNEAYKTMIGNLSGAIADPTSSPFYKSRERGVSQAARSAASARGMEGSGVGLREETRALGELEGAAYQQNLNAFLQATGQGAGGLAAFQNVGLGAFGAGTQARQGERGLDIQQGGLDLNKIRYENIESPQAKANIDAVRAGVTQGEALAIDSIMSNDTSVEQKIVSLTPIIGKEKAEALRPDLEKAVEDNKKKTEAETAKTGYADAVRTGTIPGNVQRAVNAGDAILWIPADLQTVPPPPGYKRVTAYRGNTATLAWMKPPASKAEADRMQAQYRITPAEE